MEGDGRRSERPAAGRHRGPDQRGQPLRVLVRRRTRCTRMYIAPPADAAATPCSGGSTGSAAAAASTARRPAGAPTPGCCTSTTLPPPPPGGRPKGGVSTSLLLTVTDISDNNISHGQRNVSPATSSSTMCPGPAPGVKSLFNQVNQMLLFRLVATMFQVH
ncbi:uncharacterized protein LOC123400187 [Hordeum vulgare subsp. vulgare]|uniref:Predicted protein n=1 Tax=Hordeum vulgare subsp. vulgare TaxID=112509 RepID=F2EA78_HORVV|nr:uncharacterized protein LOC123400187 [Hordeum vulgare subsp. vulgare]XP_044950541.1 uncharacterized protein LOC123400187 [Hordeum vulgare subsp. vulgare]XP_044950542.1 uncharacterized protein LOC123400187 [Hordeum vulgare subsp. vulgare]XP_044950543.1 uncharacterized protein LOC123400187 [Hordeum vulgare subsp. vulgare]XP_044950544.1 uncharacterized protein LOC123400187 [Hordeum vulgare subsp. vulgare]XP_044950545.1 uncharacterized protein LOC123400187 [Hordeum vulgare subsp. vulgare]XP_04